MELRLESQQLDQRASLAPRGAHRIRERAIAGGSGEVLADDGIVPLVSYRRSELLAEQLAIRLEIERSGSISSPRRCSAQLASQRARSSR
jgi:hypothetical protein